MSRSILGHISKRTMHTILGVIVALIVLFFAATRTEVGREVLARQIEAQFAAQTNGTLSIGMLTGNVTQDLFASEVQLRDSTGTLLMTIDSVIVRPKWSSLIQREFVVHEIRLLRPILDVRNPETWAAVFSRDVASTLEEEGLRASEDSLQMGDRSALQGTESPWTFSNATLHVEDGRVETPSIDQVNMTSIDSLSLSSLFSWEDGVGQIDLISFEANLPESGIRISDTIAQAVISENEWSLNQLSLETDQSRIRMRGSLGTITDQASWTDRPFQLELEDSEVNFDEWSRFIPALPLRSRAQLGAYVSGPMSALTIPWIRWEKGASNFAAEGTITGYPGEAEVELSVSEARLDPVDLQALLPSSRQLRNLQATVSGLQLYTNGSVRLDPDGEPSWRSVILDTRSTFDVQSTAGMLSGTLSLSGTPVDSLAHALTLRVEGLDGYPWTSRARWRSRANGIVSVNGTLIGLSEAQTQITGRLNDLSWGARQADSVSVDIQIRPGGLRGTVDLFAGEGSLRNQIELEQRPGIAPVIATESVARQLDVGVLIGRPGIRSRINAALNGNVSLAWNRGFEADLSVDVDSSFLQMGERSTDVPPHLLDVTIAPPERNRPVLELTSSMGDLKIDSEISLPTMVALTQAWGASVTAALDTEGRKLLDGTVGEQFNPEIALNVLLSGDAANTRFPLGMTSAQTVITASLTDGALVSALSPTFPRLDGVAEATAQLDWSPQSLSARVDANSPVLRVGAFGMSAPTVAAAFSLSRNGGLLETMSSELNAQVDSIRALGSVYADNRIEWRVAEGMGTFSVVSSGTERLDGLSLAGVWTHEARRNALRITDITVDTGDGAWILNQMATFGLFGDATSLDGMRIAFQRDGVPTGQSIFAGGTLSSFAQDSLMVAFNDLEMRPLSEYMEWRRIIGGLVNADLVLRGGLSQPRITGSMAVDTLSLDHRILGNVVFESDFVASRPDVAVELRLDPIAPNERAVLYGTDFPAEIVQNELSISGDVRFPGSGEGEDGMLDLEAMIDQANVFWLKYIFSEVLGSVDGFLSGDGTITGTFAYPLFNARLGVVDGRFDIPYTQASYSANGTLRVDEEAIHFEPLRLIDDTGGQANLTGKLLFNEYTSFTFDMDGRLDEFQIMNVAESDELPFYGFLWASGDLTLDGPLFNARLVSTNGETTANSELFIPIVEETTETDLAFIVFEETPGVIPDFRQLESRSSILQRRPSSERQFLDGLNLDLNIDAPPGSIVHLVIDPLLGDVINAVSTGNVQLILENDEFQVFGRLDVTSGDYQFTAGELFIKTFLINPGGFIEWSGDPINATLNIPASYRTRASRAGLPGAEGERPGVIPLIVDLQIGGTVESPEVGLSLSIDASNQNVLGEYQALEALLNQPDRATEYATSVLILNSFQLTTENITTDSGGQLAFNSVSQLVTAQLNRFLESALPNVDFSLGLQGESAQDLDVTYGVALRLLNERLIIRGEGVYQGARSTENIRTSDGLQGEFVVEIRVGPRVSVEVFFRRESDILESTQLTNTAGVGLSYQTEFESWRSIIFADVDQ